MDEPTVEALRTQFLHDLFERVAPFSSPGGLWDRLDQQYVVSVTVTKVPAPPSDPSEDLPSSLLTRPQRAHWRLSWEQRLSRNARSASSSSVTVTLHGLPAAFAQIYGFVLCDGASV